MRDADESARGARRCPVSREGTELDVEDGRDAERCLEEVGGVEVERDEEAVRAGGREVEGRAGVSLGVAGRDELERGALEDAGRDFGRGGVTNAGTSKSSLKGSKGSRGALRRGINSDEYSKSRPPCGTKTRLTFYQWFLGCGCGLRPVSGLAFNTIPPKAVIVRLLGSQTVALVKI